MKSPRPRPLSLVSATGASGLRSRSYTSKSTEYRQDGADGQPQALQLPERRLAGLFERQTTWPRNARRMASLRFAFDLPSRHPQRHRSASVALRVAIHDECCFEPKSMGSTFRAVYSSRPRPRVRVTPRVEDRDRDR